MSICAYIYIYRCVYIYIYMHLSLYIYKHNDDSMTYDIIDN